MAPRPDATLRLDGYIRVSRVGKRDPSSESYITEKDQRAQIERWAELRGVTIAKWFVDRDVSGGSMQRPEFNKLMARIRQRVTDGVAVAYLDRFSRAGVADALATVQQIDDAGGQLAAVDLGIDPTTPFGEFAMTLMLALARMRRRQIGQMWSVAQERAVARGVHIASKTPTGYVRRDDGRLEPHPEWGSIVGDLFRMRAAGSSWRELADHLNAHHVTGPYGSPHWRTRAVEHIIRNRVYLGEARSGRHANPDAHEPIIDRAMWERAQVARGTSVPRSGEPAVLAGLLRCAGCRYVMKPDKMPMRDGEKVRLYRCRGEHAAGTCPDRAATLERVVLPLVEEEFFRIADGIRAESVGSRMDLGAFEREADLASADLAAYRDDTRIADLLGTNRYVEGLEVRVARDDAAQRALADARSRTGGLPLHVDLRELWPDLSATEKQKLLMLGLDAVMLRSGRSLPIGDRVLILRRGEAPADLPRRGVRVPLAPFAWPD